VQAERDEGSSAYLHGVSTKPIAFATSPLFRIVPLAIMLVSSVYLLRVIADRPRKCQSIGCQRYLELPWECTRARSKSVDYDSRPRLRDKYTGIAGNVMNGSYLNQYGFFVSCGFL